MPTKKETTEEKAKPTVAKPVKEKAPTKKSLTKEPASEKDDKSTKIAILKEKAKLLEKTVSGEQGVDDLKKQIKPDQDQAEADTLVPIEDYLKSSIHLGTRVITPDMKDFVYKRRADGLAVFNTTLLDEKMRESADFLSNYAPEDIIIVCKREAGWKAVKLFSKTTGIESFTKQYPAGILTNPNLEDFREAELVVICDPWIDKNALKDAKQTKIPVLSICDTNNYTYGVTKKLPGNNKSAKSLGMILYLLAKLYVEKRKLKTEVPDIADWIENWENLVPPK